MKHLRYVQKKMFLEIKQNTCKEVFYIGVEHKKPLWVL